MLILSRKTDQSIIIGDEVTLTILAVKGTQVRLGITAPDDISVHRQEVYERIQSGLAASEGSSDSDPEKEE